MALRENSPCSERGRVTEILMRTCRESFILRSCSSHNGVLCSACHRVGYLECQNEKVIKCCGAVAQSSSVCVYVCVRGKKTEHYFCLDSASGNFNLQVGGTQQKNEQLFLKIYLTRVLSLPSSTEPSRTVTADTNEGICSVLDGAETCLRIFVLRGLSVFFASKEFRAGSHSFFILRCKAYITMIILPAGCIK